MSSLARSGGGAVRSRKSETGQPRARACRAEHKAQSASLSSSGRGGWWLTAEILIPPLSFTTTLGSKVTPSLVDTLRDSSGSRRSGLPFLLLDEPATARSQLVSALMQRAPSLRGDEGLTWRCARGWAGRVHGGRGLGPIRLELGLLGVLALWPGVTHLGWTDEGPTGARRTGQASFRVWAEAKLMTEESDRLSRSRGNSSPPGARPTTLGSAHDGVNTSGIRATQAPTHTSNFLFRLHLPLNLELAALLHVRPTRLHRPTRTAR